MLTRISSQTLSTHRGHVILKRGEIFCHTAPDVFDESLLSIVEPVAIAVERKGTCAKDAPSAGILRGVAVEVQVEDVTSPRLGREQRDAFNNRGWDTGDNSCWEQRGSSTLAVKAGGCEIEDGTPVAAGTALLNGILEAVIKLVHDVDLRESMRTIYSYKQA